MEFNNDTFMASIAKLDVQYFLSQSSNWANEALPRPSQKWNIVVINTVYTHLMWLERLFLLGYNEHDRSLL